MEVRNPTTGERVAAYEEHDDAALEAAVEDAVAAFEEWRERPLAERERVLASAADLLRERDRELAETATREMGKPVRQALGEVRKCARACEHYAEHAGSYLAAETHPSPPGTTAKTVHDPIGPVLGVMPWNFPYWQVIRFAVPQLAAGNVVLLKHAPEVPGCALAVEELLHDAGVPADAFQALLVGERRVDDAVAGLVADDSVRGVAVTGSPSAGRSVAAAAGEHLTRHVLELGGSDPFVVLSDADLEAAAETGAWARALNGGQVCCAAKRFVVHEAVHDEFVDLLVEELESLDVGDPADEDTDVGPLARPDLVDTLHEQVEASVDAGATVRVGGEPLDREGAFYPPTVLTDVPRGCPVDAEETFGPVAAVYEVADAEAALELANDTDYGLGASVWTADRERGERLAREIDAGMTFVNELVKSDPRVPFGGLKDSGYGRELGEAGIREFVDRKTVWVE